jgi:hypothetical protein
MTLICVLSPTTDCGFAGARGGRGAEELVGWSWWIEVDHIRHGRTIYPYSRLWFSDAIVWVRFIVV